MLCLDIGSNSIKLCDLVDDGLGWQVELLAHAAVPHGLIVQGQITDPPALIELLRALVTKHQLRGRDVALAFSSTSAIVRLLQVPSMTDDELAEQMHSEAEQALPYAASEVYLAWRVVRRAPDTLDVEFGADKRTVIDPVIAVVRAAWLQPIYVGLASLAVADWFRRQHKTKRSSVVVDIGANGSELIMFADRRIAAARAAPRGGEHLTSALTQRLQASRDDAERTKLQAYFDHPEEQQGPYRGSNTGAMVQATIAAATAELAEELAAQITSTIAAAQAPPPETIWLSGGSAALPELAQTLRQRLNVNIEQWLPYSGLRTRRAADATTLLKYGPQLAVAFGLAPQTTGLRIASLRHTRWWQFWRR